MRHWLRNILSNFTRPPSRSLPSTRPALEQLEDRCMPSANMMMSMGMSMPPMGMNMTSMPAMGMNVTSSVRASEMAALNQLFMDFDRTLQQVLASRTMQQFVVNETAMIQTVLTDLAHFNAVASSVGRTM